MKTREHPYSHANNRVVPTVVIGDMQDTTPIYHRIKYMRAALAQTATYCGLVAWANGKGWSMPFVPTRHASKFARPCKKCWPELWSQG